MQKKLIWDWPLRLFHWLLVISLVAQYVTAELMDDAMQWHFYFGYFTIGLILFRIIWGFFGPRYARFSQFLAGPKTISQYILKKSDTPPHAGHNPLGGWAVLTLLALVLIQGVSGLFMTDDILWDGPLYHLVNSETQTSANWLHHNIFNALLVVVALHILAVLFYVFIKKQPLIRAMIHGKKPTDEPAIASSMIIRACIIGLAVFAALYVLVSMAPA